LQGHQGSDAQPERSGEDRCRDQASGVCQRMKDEGGRVKSTFVIPLLILHPSSFFFGVWCNASIRVLGTRGDSSILSSPTNTNKNDLCSLCFVLCTLSQYTSFRQDQNTKFKAPLPASLVQSVQDTALPALRHRFESGTMLHSRLRIADFRMLIGRIIIC